MFSGKRRLMATLCLWASFMTSCDRSDSGNRSVHSDDKSHEGEIVNLFIWADYLAPDTLTSFEKLTGVKVL